METEYNAPKQKAGEMMSCLEEQKKQFKVEKVFKSLQKTCSNDTSEKEESKKKIDNFQ